jgi:hypothetical protein
MSIAGSGVASTASTKSRQVSVSVHREIDVAVAGKLLSLFFGVTPPFSKASQVIVPERVEIETLPGVVHVRHLRRLQVVAKHFGGSAIPPIRAKVLLVLLRPLSDTVSAELALGIRLLRSTIVATLHRDARRISGYCRKWRNL